MVTGLAWGGDGGTYPPAALHVTTVVVAPTNPLNPQFVQEAAVSNLGTMSIWFYPTVNFGFDADIFFHLVDAVGVITYNEIGVGGGFVPFIRLRQNAGPTVILEVVGTTALTLNAWNHVLMSWDLTAGSVYATEFHMYLNDVDVKPGAPTTFTAGSPGADWAGGGNPAGYRLSVGNGLGFVAGDPRYSAVFLSWSQYTDLSITANRRLWSNALGEQIGLGVNGQIPLGFSPSVYLDDPAASVAGGRGVIPNWVIDTPPRSLVDKTPAPPAVPDASSSLYVILKRRRRFHRI